MLKDILYIGNTEKVYKLETKTTKEMAMGSFSSVQSFSRVQLFATP